MEIWVYLWSYLAEFFIEWEMFQTNLVDKITSYFMFNNFIQNFLPFMR